jgi:hypothetical protein
LNPSAIGQPVTFTAVVSASGFQGTPTGTVTFTIDGHAQPPVALSVVGGKDEALLTTSTLTAGPHSVSAAYSGDANVSPSTGSLLTQTVIGLSVKQKATTTTIASSLNTTTVGQQVTFTVVVSPGASTGAPSGTVTFTIDGTPQALVSLQLVKGVEVATLSTAALTAGRHTISASYSGNTAFASSTVASPLIQTVNPAAAPGLDGPTVMSVNRYGIHMQPTVLVLAFNDGLDPTSAQDLNNYKVVGPVGQTMRIRSAVFDPAANTVTLRFSKRINIHHNYELTVIGTGPIGVTDTSARLLDGANSGQPGSDYNGIFDWGSVVWTPAEAKKYDTPANAKKYDHPKPVKLVKSVKPAGARNHRFVSKSR